MKKVCQYFLTLSILFFTVRGFAQQTQVYIDPDVSYKKGIELFQQQKFGPAQELFNETVSEITQRGTVEDHLLLINASYYSALCSKNLKRPDAEKRFLDLVSGNEENPTTRLAYFQLGDIYFDEKKYDKSITWYKKVDPADLNEEEKTEYDFSLGFSYFYKKDFEKANKLFTQVKDIKGPYYYPANYYYGYISYKQGNYTEAMKSFKVVEQSELYRSIVPYYIANIYFQQKKYDEVVNYASAFTTGDNLQYAMEMQQLIGKSYFEKGQYQKATPYFTAYMSGVSKLNKSDIYQIGYCQYEAKNYAEAINSFKELNVLKDSLGQNAMYLLGDCYLRTNQKNSARLAFEQSAKMNFDPFVQENASFQFAKLSYELNYHDVSVKALQDFLSAYPNSVFSDEAKEYLTLEFLGTQNYKSALAILKSMPAKNPRIRQAYQKVSYSRATELYNSKDYDSALAVFDQSLKNPVDQGLQAAAYFWKGEVYYNQKKYNDAVKSHLEFLDLVKSKSKLPSNVSVVNSSYTLGYSYLKLEDYNRAAGYFNDVMKTLASSNDVNDKKLYADAALRDGDCEFVTKNYASAISSYDIITSKKLQGADYALYQKAIIQGLQNKSTDKLATLKRITTDYPSSIYIDDALYELGVSYLAVPSYQDAASVFNQIISRYPNSSYVRKAHLKMGLIYFNLDNDQKALDEYQWVLSKYPKSPEGSEALSGVKEIYTAKGDAQGYLNFVKGVPNANVTDAVKDSVMYLAAETKYSKSDCMGAVKEFSDYLKAFPVGAFALHAHFYRAECLFKQKDYEASLADYSFVADQPQNRFTEKSLLNAARISYVQKKDYGTAYKYYRLLSENAEFKADNLEALKGMMYSSYYLNQYEDAASAAQQILSAANAKNDVQTEAHYYLAKISFAKNDLTKSFSEFASVAKEKSAIGAEASYMMAEIYFKQSNLKASEEQCNSLIKQKPSYDYWIAKSYLLIASIFDQEGDYFQAKSTLQSIIDNYKGADEVVATAKQKLESVTSKESNVSKLKSDNQDNDMELDSVPNNN